MKIERRTHEPEIPERFNKSFVSQTLMLEFNLNMQYLDTSDRRQAHPECTSMYIYPFYYLSGNPKSTPKGG
jgi:hypothetical protein